MDRDTMSADDALGVAIVPLGRLIFAEGVDPFAGAWAPTAPGESAVPRAQALFREIVNSVKDAPRYYRSRQSEWIRIAKQHLKN